MNCCPKCGAPTGYKMKCPECGFELYKIEKKYRVNVPDPSFKRKELATEKPNHQLAKLLIIMAKEEAKARIENSPENRLRRARMELVGPKAEQYVSVFEHLDKNGGRTWNWCGCLVAPFWLAYRKMYAWSAIVLAAPMIAGFLYVLLASPSAESGAVITNPMIRVVDVACAFVFGFLANRLYKNRIDKLAAEIPEADEEREQYVKSKGGVSIAGVVVAILIRFALTFGLMAL